MFSQILRGFIVATILMLLSISPIDGTSAATADYDGSMPSGRIVAIENAVYGTTEYGGPNCRERKSNLETRGCGVIYRLSGDGVYSVLHAFNGSDGEQPTSGLVGGRDGQLYGATNAGGTHGHGAIYRLAPDGSGFTILHSFESGDRHGTLTIANDGTIYGVAPSPGGDGHGATVFSLSSGGAYRMLHSFGSESHVASPLLLDGAGRLYGIVVRAQDCGGELFSIEASGAYDRVFSNAVPYTSRQCAAAGVPSSPLVASAGTIYATDAASLYSVGGDGFKALFTLPSTQAPPRNPWSAFARKFVDGSLAIAPNGSLIGAVTGYNRTRCGIVFQFSQSSGYTALHKFDPADGACFSRTANPVASAEGFAYAADGALYGTATEGADCSKHDARPAAPHSCQSLYRITDAGTTVLHVFEPLEPSARDENKHPWGAWIGALGERPTNRLTLSVGLFQLSQVPFSLRTGTSALALRPVDDPSKKIPLRFEQEVTNIAQPSPDSREVTGVITMGAQALAPDMYTLDMSRFDPVITDADGYGISMNGPYPTSLYEPPPPTALPQFRAGQEFVTFTLPETNTQRAQLPGGIRVVTLETVEHEKNAGYRLRFNADDSDATLSVDAQSTDVNSVPGLTPIVDDANVDTLNREYQGHDVYVLGDFAPTCGFAGGNETYVRIDRSAPLHVRQIVRLYGVSASWGIGPMTDRMYDAGDIFVAVDPILVIFDGTMDGEILAEPPFSGRGCVSGYAEFADGWEFDRTLAYASPLLSHPEWPADVRKAINDGTVLIGMTYDMVVASVGYPSAYGTAAQMRKLTTWEYVLPAPSSFTVKFKDGKVVFYDPPRMLP
jgi:uncharacterized repeat protein (TIGR03803 family)